MFATLVQLSWCAIFLDDGLYTVDDSSILSESRNFTVHPNETVHLPCLVKKSPNTVVIWNQCDDPECTQVRSPLTINKDNFIQDLRFRIVSENLINTTMSSNTAVNSDPNESTDSDFYITNKSQINERDAIIETKTNDDDSSTNINTDLNSWNLEIRKFSKHDEACYQCQLNSFKTKTIYYCLKLQKKVTAKPKKLTVQLDEPIKLRCSTDENVRMSSIKWYRNGHKIIEDSNDSNVVIERVPSNDLIHSTLLIKKATLNDAGSYMCKFEKIHEKMHVDVVIGQKSSGDKTSVVRSNMENKKLVSSFSNSISIASSANPSKIIPLSTHSGYLMTLMISILYSQIICRN